MRRGIVIRLAVLLADAAVIVLFALAIPARYGRLATLCARSCATSQAPVSMGSPKLPVETYVTVLIILEGTFALLHLLAALWVLWRRASHPMAFFVASTFVMWGTTFVPTMGALSASDPVWTWPVAIARFLGAAALTLFFYVFPDGRFRPRWAAWLAVLWIISQAPRYFAPQSILSPDTWPPLLLAVVSGGFLGVMIALQVYRYHWVSNPAEQRQTKWVVIGIGGALTGYAALLLLLALSPGLAQPGTPGYLTVITFEEACVALLPISVSIAILRDRLYDVDQLINRTLVYGTLTATLTAVYAACVIVLQQVVRMLSGQSQRQDPVIIVVSTLAVIVMVQPLRRRIQNSFDRRFFRRRYNAANTLATFSAALRNEVELDHLTLHLVQVVEQTMEPASIWFWLAPFREKGANTLAMAPDNHIVISAHNERTGERDGEIPQRDV